MCTDIRRKTIERAAIKQDGGKLLLRRWAATWIDFIVLFAGFIAISTPMATVDLADTQRSNMVFGGVVAAALVWVFGYYIVGETVWGRTLGKLITGIIVVGPTGERPGLGRVLLRTLARLVEVNPFLIGGLPAGIILLFSEKNRRLGDMMASTYVMPVKNLTAAKVLDTAVFE